MEKEVEGETEVRVDIEREKEKARIPSKTLDRLRDEETTSKTRVDAQVPIIVNPMNGREEEGGGGGRR